MPKVDVVIPFYNVRIDFTRTAIASVMAQTFTDWRAIVVNDGACESSTAELEMLIAELDSPQIVYIRQENKGLSGARNAGIRASDSPYVATLDADDAWFPQKLERQVAALDSRPDVTVVYGGADYVFPDHTVPYTPGSQPFSGELSGEGFFLRMLQNNLVGTNTPCFRREDAETAGLFDEAFTSLEDKEFWLRMIIHGARFLYLDESLAIYRHHGTNMTRNAEKMWQGRVRLIDKLDTLVADLPPTWTRVNWPELRRQMVHHAYRERAEACLETGQFGQAWKYSLPWYCGVSPHAALLSARSIYRIVRSASAGSH